MEGPVAETIVDEPAATEVGSEAPDSGEPRLIETELLVEEISIDGMCGVY